MTSLQLARLCKKYALDKKAIDPVILDLRKIEGPAEMFLICSAESDPQIKAIANNIEQMLHQDHHVKPWSVQGTPMSRWIVMDYSWVLVHVMHEERRAYYGLEDLWSDAKRVS